MLKSFKKTSLYISASLLLFSSTALGAWAAKVPAGVELAPEQKITVQNSDEPKSLDPHKSESTVESNLNRQLFESLTISDEEGNIIPGAAEKWETADLKTWIFHLRKDGKWSNGEPLTAQDFVYSWQRLVDPDTASPYSSYLTYGKVLNADEIIAGKAAPTSLGIKALDDYTLEITLTDPVPYLPKILNYTALSPVPKAAIEKYGIKWTQPANIVTNGAYKLKDWKLKEVIVLERNPEYWDNEHTVIDEVKVLPITSETTALNLYKSGQLDFALTIPIDSFEKVKKEMSSDLYIYPKLCTYYYQINMKKPPFTDARVRMALKLGLDNSILAEKVAKPAKLPLYSFTAIGTNGADLVKPEWYLWPMSKRIEKAKELLKEAGYDEKHPLKFELAYNTLEGHKQLAVAAASIWKKNLNVEADLNNYEWKVFLDVQRNGDYEVARGAWCADYDEPTTFLNILTKTSSNNTLFYDNPEYDKTLQMALTAKDDKERTEIYQKAEAILDEDTPFIPVYSYISPALLRPYIKGFSGKDAMENFKFKDFYIVKH